MKKQVLIFCILISCIVFNKAAAQLNYQWVKGIGSSLPGDDVGHSIAVDDSGSVYVTGRFDKVNTDFNPFGSPSVNLSNTGIDCFFAKYNANGNCIWAKKMDLGIGLGNIAVGNSIAVDGNHNIYISGIFSGSVDFDPDPNSSYSLTSIAGGDIGLDCFFAKYDSTGAFQWVKHFAGNGDDIGTGIVVDGQGSGIYITGSFSSDTAKFYSNISTVDISLTNAGEEDIFLAKYDPSGVFQWANRIGNSGEDNALAIDANDTWLAITGSFQDTVDFGSGLGNPEDTLISLGTKDAFFAKFDFNGSMVWAYNIGGQVGSNALGTGVAMDDSSINITGVFKGAIDFIDPQPPFSILKTLNSTGSQDVFIAKYQISHSFDFANKIGGNDNQVDSISSSDIVVDTLGKIYLTGAFKGQTDFNPLGGDNLVSSGSMDIFFAKYDEYGVENWAKRMGSSDKDISFGIAVGNSENIYLTGTFNGTVNFDPGVGVANRTSLGNFGTDIFIAKYRIGTDTITGMVTYSAGTVSIGTNFAKLYKHNLNGPMHLVDSVLIDQVGVFTFYNVPTDNYIVLANANILDYPLLAPTYNGNTTHWEFAPVIPTTPDTATIVNISMVEYSTLTGNATLSGTVKEGDGFNRIAGDPIPSVPIGLEGDPGNIIIGNTLTDADGKYEFNNVPPGNYTIYVNIPGLPMDSSYHVQVIAFDSIPNLDFVADSSSIDTVPNMLNAVTQFISEKTNILIYPNPYKGFTTIEFQIPETKQVQLEVYNLLGEKAAELLNEQKQAGIIKYRLNAINMGLKPGIYLLELKIGDNISTKKIIQIE